MWVNFLHGIANSSGVQIATQPSLAIPHKTFAEIVDYGESYRGVQRIVGPGDESAGRVV